MDGDAGFAKWVIDGVIESRTCPRRIITERSRYLIDLFGHYRNGCLLVAGGIADQPHFYLSAMALIRSTLEADSGGSARTN